MKTKQPLIACFNASMLLVVSVAARADLPPLLPLPAPQQVLLQLSAADTLLSSFSQKHMFSPMHMPVSTANNAAKASTMDSETLSHAVRTLLQGARETGDQRLLGQALQLLDSTSEPQNSIETKLLRANVYQALHRFEPAVSALQEVLNAHPRHPQALLMLATLYTVRGDYTAAQRTCKALMGQALSGGVPSLLSGSCSSVVLARQGQPHRAYALLEQLYTQTAPTSTDANVVHYAQVSLAEIAEQKGDATAAHWWQQARMTQPNDLYTRIGATRNALHRGDYQTVIALSENFTDIDALQLLRAQALQHTSPDEALVLRHQLANRVQAARDRGDTLHARDQAAILLDLLLRPDEALTLAQHNWESQREPEDTALLLRAALAANRLDIYEKTHDWLKMHEQWHARYPAPPASQRQSSTGHTADSQNLVSIPWLKAAYFREAIQ